MSRSPGVFCIGRACVRALWRILVRKFFDIFSILGLQSKTT